MGSKWFEHIWDFLRAPFLFHSIKIRCLHHSVVWALGNHVRVCICLLDRSIWDHLMGVLLPLGYENLVSYHRLVHERHAKALITLSKLWNKALAVKDWLWLVGISKVLSWVQYIVIHLNIIELTGIIFNKCELLLYYLK